MPAGVYPRKKINHICKNCNTTQSRIENNSEHWYRYQDGYLCKVCYDSYRHSTYSKKRMTYKGERIHLEDIPRKGICSICGKKGKTDLHHEKYDDSDPLAHTVEVCKSCHIAQGWNLGQFEDKMNNFSLIMNRDPKTGRFKARTQ